MFLLPCIFYCPQILCWRCKAAAGRRIKMARLEESGKQWSVLTLYLCSSVLQLAAAANRFQPEWCVIVSGLVVKDFPPCQDQDQWRDQRILVSLNLIGRQASALEGSEILPAPGTMEGSSDASPIFISYQGVKTVLFYLNLGKSWTNNVSGCKMLV